MTIIHGSVDHHELTVARRNPHNRGRRYCPFCETKSKQHRAATHVGMANGVVMMLGCEWHAHKWLRDALKRRRS